MMQKYRIRARFLIPACLWLFGIALWIFIAAEDRSSASAVTIIGMVPKDSSDATITESKNTNEFLALNSCINVNTADERELDALPGVGPVLAKRIVEYRNSNNGIRSASELDKVKGIGPSMLRKLTGKVCY